MHFNVQEQLISWAICSHLAKTHSLYSLFCTKFLIVASRRMDSSSLHVVHCFRLYSILYLLNESELMVHKPSASSVLLLLLPSLFLLHRVCVNYSPALKCSSRWRNKEYQGSLQRGAPFWGPNCYNYKFAEWELQPPLPSATQDWEDDDHLKWCYGVESILANSCVMCECELREICEYQMNRSHAIKGLEKYMY